MAKKVQSSTSNSIPPVVTVLGHVDHGKTSLLDSIRKTTISASEHGGITQKIGASSVEIEHEGKKRRITFIDTPGHEAFKLMRGRGVQAADIALLVVSSADGVMPQTKESIQLIKASKIPFIVVLTKSDLVDKQVEKTKGQLLKEEVALEGQGGDVPYISVSSKTNTNIKELLDLILLVSDLHASASSAQALSDKFRAIVIESKLDPKAGPKATIVIKGGKLSIKDEIATDGIKAKVRSISNDQGKTLASAEAGSAVEILGFEKVPKVGSVIEFASDAVEKPASPQNFGSLPTYDEDQRLKVIIVADTQGSLEAIENNVGDSVNVVLSKTGDIESSDIMFAKSTGAVILSFNAKIKNEIQKLAENEKILVRNYTLIYEMLSEIEDFLKGTAEALKEKILGKAQILASFPYDRQKVLGVKVIEGRIAKGDRVRLIRDLPTGRQGNENIIGESSISSLRAGKDQISKAEQGEEAGVLLSSSLDFNLGDVLVSHA